MKNFFSGYINYLKDNPKGYWFKRKLYGLGWTPATREGWLVIIIFLALMFGNIIRVVSKDITEQSAEAILVPTFIFVVLLLIVCFKKGEPLKWQWGEKKKDE